MHHDHHAVPQANPDIHAIPPLTYWAYLTGSKKKSLKASEVALVLVAATTQFYARGSEHLSTRLLSGVFMSWLFIQNLITVRYQLKEHAVQVNPGLRQRDNHLLHLPLADHTVYAISYTLLTSAYMVAMIMNHQRSEITHRQAFMESLLGFFTILIPYYLQQIFALKLGREHARQEQHKQMLLAQHLVTHRNPVHAAEVAQSAIPQQEMADLQRIEHNVRLLKRASLFGSARSDCFREINQITERYMQHNESRLQIVAHASPTGAAAAHGRPVLHGKSANIETQPRRPRGKK